MKAPRWLTRPRKGQSFLELSVFMVVLLLILVGVMEFGMLFFEYIAMEDAASEGAVYASMYPGNAANGCNQTIERVKKGLYNVDPAKVEVVVRIDGTLCHLATAAQACANHEAKVTVRQPNYPIMVPFLGTVLGTQTVSITAENTSTIIRPPCP